MNCYYLAHHMYVNRTKDGYLVKPCCRANTSDQHVKDISLITSSNLIKDIKHNFSQNQKHCACAECWNNEKLGLESKRQLSLSKLSTARGIEDWDIRPGNICNLKCIMCDPYTSSKWLEDVEIYNNTFKQYKSKKGFQTPEIDWRKIEKGVINKAKRIYIAGGEPFYMKNAVNFLEKISEYEWNRKNTFIDIQTNGISFNERALEILNRFDCQHIGFSIDGWKEVNEIIRYPTDWKNLYKNLIYFKEYYTSKTKTISVNVTVSALNLPDIPNLIKNLEDIKIHLNELYFPEILHINSLHPDAISSLRESTNNIFLNNLIDNYTYDSENNYKMRNYLQALDKKRNTDSKSILPWCWLG